MNTYLQRYVGQTILIAILAVLLMILGLDFFLTLVREFSRIGQGDYNFLEVIYYTLLTLPVGVYTFFPMAALLGTLLGLGHLAASSELTVMRASGVSLWQITAMVLRVAVIMILVVIFFGEVIGPKTIAYAKERRQEMTASGDASIIKTRVWLRDNDEFVYIDHALSNDQMRAVTRYRFEGENLVEVIHARRAVYQGNGWLMLGVTQEIIEPTQIVATQWDEYPWATTIQPGLFFIIDNIPTRLAMVELYEFIQYLRANSLDASKYEVAFWRKVFQPLATVAMMLLAMPFIFGPLRSGSVGVRTMVGIVAGLGFYLINELFIPFSQVFSIPPAVAGVFPSLTCLILAALVMRRFA